MWNAVPRITMAMPQQLSHGICGLFISSTFICATSTAIDHKCCGKDGFTPSHDNKEEEDIVVAIIAEMKSLDL